VHVFAALILGDDRTLVVWEVVNGSDVLLPKNDALAVSVKN
jgi:hypothetical protein